MWDEIALVVAGSLIFGGCGMQLEGEPVAENILDGGTTKSVHNLRVKYAIQTWIIRKMSTDILRGVKNIRTDWTFDRLIETMYWSVLLNPE
jgi:hypothetical protein